MVHQPTIAETAAAQEVSREKTGENVPNSIDPPAFFFGIPRTGRTSHSDPPFEPYPTKSLFQKVGQAARLPGQCQAGGPPAPPSGTDSKFNGRHRIRTCDFHRGSPP